MTEVFVNGRVLRRPPGGVQRYATELATALDAQVIEPRSARFPWSARVWEQTVLPARARRGVLVNPAHAAPLAHRKSVVVVHDLFAIDRPHEVRRSFAELMARQLPAAIRAAAAVVAVSQTVADEVADRFGIDRSRVAVAPPGVSPAFSPGDRRSARQRLGLPDDRPVVSTLYDPAPRKRGVDALAALDTLASNDDVYTVAAGRPAASFARATDRPATSRVNWMHAPDDASLADLWRASDVVLAASPHEGFGLPPVEAAACGAAVISRPVPSVTVHGAGAAHVVDGPSDDLIEATRELLAEPEERDRRRCLGIAAVGHLRWKHTAENVQTVIDHLEAR